MLLTGVNNHYPIPSYAVYTWLRGDKLYVMFPPTLGTKAHTVIFPATEKGISLFLSVLKERKPGHIPIATPGEPTQYQVERARVKDRKYKAKARATAQQAELLKMLEDIGL